MRKTVVLNVVGLSGSLIGENTPFLKRWSAKGQQATIQPAMPAVTCSVQATYLTGKWPEEHGIVGNGWYFKDECEIKFWRQSNKLIQAPKIWEVAKAMDPSFTVSNMCWWYNMYSSADYALTPRPQYLADGRKLPDCYTQPAELRDELQAKLGTFPLFNYWGPATSIKSSKWIADASKITDDKYNPTLTLIYLPHLDYNLQRFGPSDPRIAKDLQEIDGVVEDLVTFYEAKGAEVLILSEYGISDAERPVHLNRVLRQEGYISVRNERGTELLDAGVSKAFAVADHQVAHIYVNDPTEVEAVKKLISEVPGVQEVLSGEERNKYNLAHDRCGDLVAIAEKGAWFTYYFWLDDAKAPDYARMVDIHKKPGFDPVEMFVNPTIKLPKLRIGGKLLKKKLGFRTVMDVIPLDASLIKGSHGRVPENKGEWPVLLTSQKKQPLPGELLATDVFDIILQHLQEPQPVHS